MPQAKNKKRTAAPSRSGASPAAKTARNALPAQDVPPDLAPLPASEQPEESIPAGLARRPDGQRRASQRPDSQRPDSQRPASQQPGGGTAPRTPAAAPAPKQPAAQEAEDKPDEVPPWAAKALEHLLTATCWLDPGTQGDPFSATIRFTGQRTDVTGKPRPGDSFTREETVHRILPGSGPVAITAEVRGINRGTWAVTARPLAHAVVGQAQSAPRPEAAAPGRVPWPRRVAVPAESRTTVRTTTLLRSKVPGIIRYAYACLVVLGVLVGLVLEALLLANGHYPLFRPMAFSVAAVAAGVVGGKTWYAAVHRGRKWDGWCIQGFVAGAAVVVAVVAVAGPGLPKGAFLAAATPALLIGMGIGRHGCFWAGCCTGRVTASRWGIWSSDRKVGCRRMPVQLLEAWTALVVGVAALIAVLLAGLPRSGPVAIAGLATYTLVRQFILGLRDEPRQWRYGRPVTATAAAIALIVGIVLFAGV